MELSKSRSQDIKLKPAIDNNLKSLEWLETNHTGAYASGTVSGINTRKYHSLLAMHPQGEAEKYNLCSKFVEEIHLDDEVLDLNPSDYVNYPAEIKLTTDFCQDLLPSWQYDVKDTLKLKRELMLKEDANCCLIKYTFEDVTRPIKFALKPLLSFTNYHHLSNLNQHYNFITGDQPNCKSYSRPGFETKLFVQLNKTFEYQDMSCLYYDLFYEEEAKRGYPAQGNLACPGCFEIEIKEDCSFVISLSDYKMLTSLLYEWDNELAQRKQFLKNNFSENNSYINALLKGARQFLVKPQALQSSIIAGFHWFTEWGRDTFIALPGLTLGTTYEKEAIQVFQRFASFEKDGLIPNLIDESGKQAFYNSVDASLWYFWAMQQFAYAWSDFSWIQENFWSTLKKIFTSYASSRPRGVNILPNGLLYTGIEDDSFTWMDALYEGKAITPRIGLVVEINALWFNAVGFMCELAARFDDPIFEIVSDMKLKIKSAFSAEFYLSDKQYLADFINEDGINSQLRPNQLLAISLPFSPLDPNLAINIFNTVEKELLTPYGLRTLATDDPEYRGIYDGDTKSRDQSYHNGTVWPWLLGPYADALFKVSFDKVQNVEKLRTILKNFETHLLEAGIGSISEIFDGDAPHLPRGCIAQAWSVAELRRLSMYAF
jgi:predicted glycogen debranching enzyme